MKNRLAAPLVMTIITMLTVSLTLLAGCAEQVPNALLKPQSSQAFYMWQGTSNDMAESACVDGPQPDEVGSFSSKNGFTKEQITNLQKSTVRLSVRPLAEIHATLKEKFSINSYDLGAFSSYAGEGLCTGTLIDSSLVLTAGHCVSPSNYYHDNSNEFPPQASVLPPWIKDDSGNFSRYFYPKELAVLFQVDFNFQKVFVAASGGTISNLAAEHFSVPVEELVDQVYENPQYAKARDFSILRLKTSGNILKEFSLGWQNLRYRISEEMAPIAVIQHPKGWPKVVATGHLKSQSRYQLLYSDITTDDGSSGAGILNADGHLVGIHTRGGCDKKHLGFVNRGARLDGIKKELDAVRQK